MGTFKIRHYYDKPIPAPEPEPEPRRSRAEQARINGAKSKGPITEEGKAKVGQNARKHGLAAKTLFIDESHEIELIEIKDAFIDSLKPQTAAEDLIIDSIARIHLRLRMADNMETDLLRDNLEQGDSIHSAFTYDPRSLMLLSTYQGRLARRMHKLFSEYYKLRKETQDIVNQSNARRSEDAQRRADFLELQETLRRHEILKAQYYESQQQETPPEPINRAVESSEEPTNAPQAQEDPSTPEPAHERQAKTLHESQPTRHETRQSREKNRRNKPKMSLRGLRTAP